MAYESIEWEDLGLPTLHMSVYKLWIWTSCSLLTAAAARAAEPMEGVLLVEVCSLSSSAAAFLLGSTYSAADNQLLRSTSLTRFSRQTSKLASL